MASILLTTFGSLGDLHPFLAIGQELQRRGHRPIVATFALFATKVAAAGLAFRPLRSALVEKPDRELMQRVLDLRHGGEFIVRQLLMPALRTAYADTLAAAEGTDLLVSHPLTFPTRLVAETQRKPWASTQLAPFGFFSAYDPPVLPFAPFLARFRPFGPGFYEPFFALVKRSVRSWTDPYRAFRQELGLSDIADPLFAGSYSPSLVLALFSEWLGKIQPDWPVQTVVTGFPWYDADEQTALTPELRRFLDAGDPPIVFTLGTSAVLDPGQFYHESAEAAQRLRRRAILLTGKEPGNRPSNLPDDVFACDYAPFSQLFPRVDAVVHQGGIGTTGQALRSGRPMLVMPYAVDQPDNAARARRLGVARVISRRNYSAARAAAELRALLTGSYRERAAWIGKQVAAQDGAVAAANHLETLLSPSSPSRISGRP